MSKQRAGIWTSCCRHSHLLGDKDTRVEGDKAASAMAPADWQGSPWMCLAFGQVPGAQG